MSVIGLQNECLTRFPKMESGYFMINLNVHCNFILFLFHCEASKNDSSGSKESS